MTHSNARKPKPADAAAKSVPRLRSAAAWRKPSLPTETDECRAALKESEAERIVIMTGHLTVSMSADLERWARTEAEAGGVSLSAWVRRLIEREYVRSQK